jgi:hypothetical protein
VPFRHCFILDEFAVALRTALRPEGKAFFYENSAMSPMLMWARRHVVG